MKLEEAFDIYIDVAEIIIDGIRQDTLHTKFKEDLLHKNDGSKWFLLESIFGDKYTVIDNDHVDPAPFWNEISEKDLSNLKNQKESKSNKLIHDFITDALRFMDSEYDKMFQSSVGIIPFI